MQFSVNVVFTGKPTEYTYRCDHLPDGIDVGDRVVVPNKLKDDGSVSLTIATVVRTEGTMPIDLKTLPVVSVIKADDIETTRQFLVQQANVLAAEAA